MTAAIDSLTAERARHQSLAHGAAGIALLSIERALADRSLWTQAHSFIRRAATGPVDGGDHTGLYYGAPAVAFLLHTAGADHRPRIREALVVLDRHTTLITRRRLAAATRRFGAGEHTEFGEYDLFFGFVGIGVLLLARHPGGDLLAEVLDYLVRLTRPRRDHGLLVPGWWVRHDPDPTLPTPGGHANFGMAHGSAGILAFLALAARAGCVVEGQHEAIERLVTWHEQWRRPSANGPWWPQWITLDMMRAGRSGQLGPNRPSWCYGSVGIIRALHLAALATSDNTRRHTAEHALLEVLTEPNLTQITEPGLCHGLAGVYQTVYRAALDSDTPALRNRLPELADVLDRHTTTLDEGHGEKGDEGLLTGRAGALLTLETARRNTPPLSGWDRCLLIA